MEGTGGSSSTSGGSMFPGKSGIQGAISNKNNYPLTDDFSKELMAQQKQVDAMNTELGVTENTGKYKPSVYSDHVG